MGSVPQYILDRGITLKTCKVWGLGFDAEAPRKMLSGRTNYDDERVIFPVRRKDGQLVGCLGRTLWDKSNPEFDPETMVQHKPKYFAYWGFPRSSHLYGIHLIDQDEWVVVVEGPIDAVRLGQHGLPAVAIMGSSFSREQGAMLREFKKVYLALDADSAGDEAMAQGKKMLKQRVYLLEMSYPEGMTDPKQMSRDEAWISVGAAVLVL